MSKPLLTIGCAVYDDFNGLWPTIQALRLGDPDAMRQCELIVVDNNPNGQQSQLIKDLLNWMKHGVVRAHYEPLETPTGTSAPRQRLFDIAEGDAVVCMDSHILLHPGTIAKLIEFYESNPETMDLYQGPMLYDDLSALNVSTHWADQWRSEMWGTWDTDPRVFLPEKKPFEIFACGLGLFTCRKEAWLGFNSRFRGFGGEECYIHTKYRQAGRKCWCLPWLMWAHRYGRPGGPPYPLTRWHKVRNYVIGHTELGLPLDRLKRHFLDCLNEGDNNRRVMDDGKTLVQPFEKHEWDLLMENPADPVEWPPGAAPYGALPMNPMSGPAFDTAPKCGTCGGGTTIPESVTLEDLFEQNKTKESDINQHAAKLRELASQCSHVTEFQIWNRVSTISLLAGQPKRFVAFSNQGDNLFGELKKRQGNCDFEFRQGDSIATAIEQTDLLFLDTNHTADWLYSELTRHAPKVRRWIAMHDTSTFGEMGDKPDKAGLLPALRRFMKENPEWSVIYHTRANHGFTVISKLQDDKPSLPSKIKMAFNYAKAVLAHKVEGSKLCTEAHGSARLDECAMCDQRADDRCSQCGCYLAEVPEGTVGLKPGPGRAFWYEQECPLGKWAEVDKRFSLPIVEVESNKAA